MTDPEMAELGHANLVAFWRESSRWGEEGQVREESGVLVFATGSWIPINCNGVFRLDPGVTAKEAVAQADEFFSQLGRGYSVKIRDSGEDDDLRAACEEAGLVPFGAGGPEMVLEARAIDVAPPPGVELRVVGSESEVGDFALVNGAAYSTYGMPLDQVAAVFSRPASVLSCAELISVVAYRAGQPVSAAQAFLSHGIAGIYWVGTVEAARGQGLGEAVTRAVGNLACDRGARLLSLQASPMGEPIYRRMGYRELYRYENWVRWSATG